MRKIILFITMLMFMLLSPIKGVSTKDVYLDMKVEYTLTTDVEITLMDVKRKCDIERPFNIIESDIVMNGDIQHLLDNVKPRSDVKNSMIFTAKIRGPCYNSSQNLFTKT